MSSHRVSKLIAALGLFAITAAMTGLPPELRLQKVREGRFTYFADLDTLSREGDIARLRSLQLADEPMVIGDKAYLGGYSWWSFDCAAQTARRLDYASLSDALVEGPVTPTRGETQELAPGGEAAELAAVACGQTPQRIDANSLPAAVEIAKAL